MGHPRHRLRRLLHRRLRSGRLVHGLGAQTRLRAVRHVSDRDRNCGAGLGGRDDRKVATAEHTGNQEVDSIIAFANRASMRAATTLMAARPKYSHCAATSRITAAESW